IVVPATPAPNNESILAPSNASAATTYTLNASPAVAGPVAVTLSGATAFGETATITGKDQAGNALTETLTLSNNGTFVTEHVFASVTDITTSGGMGAQAQLSAAIEPLQQPTVGNLVTAINAAGLSHGVQAALDTQGRFIVYSAPTNYGPDGTALGTPAQVVGNGELGLTSATTFQGGGAITITGPAGTATFNTFAGEGVGQL